jgi:hypothetical protein
MMQVDDQVIVLLLQLVHHLVTLIAIEVNLVDIWIVRDDGVVGLLGQKVHFSTQLFLQASDHRCG